MDRDALGSSALLAEAISVSTMGVLYRCRKLQGAEAIYPFAFFNSGRAAICCAKGCELLLGGPGRWWLSQVAERTSEPVAETMIAAFQQLLRDERYSLNASLG
jgi:hypothetical protein